MTILDNFIFEKMTVIANIFHGYLVCRKIKLDKNRFERGLPVIAASFRPIRFEHTAQATTFVESFPLFTN